jgi:hypothetical protein
MHRMDSFCIDQRRPSLPPTWSWRLTNDEAKEGAVPLPVPPPVGVGSRNVQGMKRGVSALGAVSACGTASRVVAGEAYGDGDGRSFQGTQKNAAPCPILHSTQHHVPGRCPRTFSLSFSSWLLFVEQI